jgi:hypothetical protein
MWHKGRHTTILCLITLFCSAFVAPAYIAVVQFSSAGPA